MKRMITRRTVPGRPYQQLMRAAGMVLPSWDVVWEEKDDELCIPPHIDPAGGCVFMGHIVLPTFADMPGAVCVTKDALALLKVRADKDVVTFVSGMGSELGAVGRVEVREWKDALTTSKVVRSVDVPLIDTEDTYPARDPLTEWREEPYMELGDVSGDMLRTWSRELGDGWSGMVDADTRGITLCGIGMRDLTLPGRYVSGDRSRSHQVIVPRSYLAALYIPDGGRVTVTVAEKGLAVKYRTAQQGWVMEYTYSILSSATMRLHDELVRALSACECSGGCEE